MGATEAVNFSTIFNVENAEGLSPTEVVNDIMTQLITTLEISLDQQVDTLSVAEQKIVQATIEEAKTFQEQLIKAEQSNKLKKILDALGVIGMLIAVVMTVVAPSPISIALLVASVVMTMEPMLADLLNYPSLIEGMMKGLQKGMAAIFGEIGGTVMTVLLIAVVAIGSAALATKFGAKAGTAMAKEFTNVAEGLGKLKDLFASGFKSLMNNKLLKDLRIEFTLAQDRALHQFFDAVQTGIVFSQSGVQINYAIVKKAGADLMKELKLQGNEIGFWNNLVDMMQADLQSMMQSRNYAMNVY